jgi:hypothetical protein
MFSPVWRLLLAFRTFLMSCTSGVPQILRALSSLFRVLSGDTGRTYKVSVIRNPLSG